MFTQILIVLAGLVMIITGAEFLVKGASGIARKAGISEFIIGLSIVAIGTSAPEMVVSLIGAFEGNSDVSAGNVLGSNIFNGLLILGTTALLMPISISKANKRFDIPWYFAFTLGVFLATKAYTLFGIGSEDILSRVGGVLLLILFTAYIFLTYRKNAKSEDEAIQEDKGKTWVYILLTFSGIGLLIYGGQVFVDGSTALARLAGLSDKFIAVTILAMGTSLPEFATSIVATMQKKGQLALGNILGSNIFNLLLVLGNIFSQKRPQARSTAVKSVFLSPISPPAFA